MLLVWRRGWLTGWARFAFAINRTVAWFCRPAERFFDDWLMSHPLCLVDFTSLGVAVARSLRLFTKCRLRAMYPILLQLRCTELDGFLLEVVLDLVVFRLRTSGVVGQTVTVTIV